MGLEHVVKTPTFLEDPAAFAALNELYAAFFPTEQPVRSTPIVQPPRGLLIPVEAVPVT